MLAALLSALLATADQPQLTDLSKGATELKKAFDKEKGCVRILLIVSPG